MVALPIPRRSNEGHELRSGSCWISCDAYFAARATVGDKWAFYPRMHAWLGRVGPADEAERAARQCIVTLASGWRSSLTGIHAVCAVWTGAVARPDRLSRIGLESAANYIASVHQPPSVGGLGGSPSSSERAGRPMLVGAVYTD